jgi:hypothetical protein
MGNIGDVKGHASSCSPLNIVSLSNEGLDKVKVSSITNFFHDDPNMPYLPLPEHAFDQNPYYPIIVINQNHYHCKLHPEMKNKYRESIEHHTKYKDPAAHKSELIKLTKLYTLSSH